MYKLLGTWDLKKEENFNKITKMSEIKSKRPAGYPKIKILTVALQD